MILLNSFLKLYNISSSSQKIFIDIIVVILSAVSITTKISQQNIKQYA